MNAEFIAVTASGLAWTVTYIALVYRGFKDKSYGMPIVPLALNIAWEVVFSIVYPPKSTGTAGLIVNIVWMVCDLGIISTYFLYSYKYFEQKYSVSKLIWILLSLFAFATAFGIMLTGGVFFGQFKPYFFGEIFQGAIFIAYFQNMIMSVCFILMLLERRNSDAQSLVIALSKCLGTGLTVGIYYLFILHEGHADLMNIIIGATFALDLIYIVLIYRQIKAEGKNPWLRF
jgi:hypothetical protein